MHAARCDGEPRLLRKIKNSLKKGPQGGIEPETFELVKVNSKVPIKIHLRKQKWIRI